MKNFNSFSRLALLFLVVSAVSAVNAQTTSDAEKAYLSWKAKQSTGSNANEGAGHPAVAFSVSKYGEVGITVDISVGVDANAIELNAMEFAVRPVATKVVDGESVFEDLGKPSRISTQPVTNLLVPESGIVASPRIVARIPNGTNAVVIEVVGLCGTGVMSVTLPIRDQVVTAVLSRPAGCGN